MNKSLCALMNEDTALSQKRGKQLSTVGQYHCYGEVHGSLLALKIRNSCFTVKGLLILGLRKHSSGYLRLLFMASIPENLNFKVF